jgi:hypothetical protein
MSHVSRLWWIVSLALLPGLACSTVTRWLTPPRVTATPKPTELAPPALATAAPDSADGVQAESGLTLGAHTATQNALANNTDILENVAEERYDSANLSQAGETYPYTINLARSLELIWQNGWCTTRADLLAQNFEHITIEFLVNGEAIDSEQFLELAGRTASGMYCQSYAMLVSDWPQGVTTLTTRVTFDEEIDDGLATYPAGTHEYEYTVTVR